MGDSLDSALDTEDLEEETEEEVSKVLDEIAAETTAALPAARLRQKTEAQPVEEEEEVRVSSSTHSCFEAPQSC